MSRLSPAVQPAHGLGSATCRKIGWEPRSRAMQSQNSWHLVGGSADVKINLRSPPQIVAGAVDPRRAAEDAHWVSSVWNWRFNAAALIKVRERDAVGFVSQSAPVRSPISGLSHLRPFPFGGFRRRKPGPPPFSSIKSMAAVHRAANRTPRRRSLGTICQPGVTEDEVRARPRTVALALIGATPPTL
jgi:hypothetical protein